MSKPANPELARKIIGIALEELGDKPPERVSMRRIAERAGVSATAIYYYYPSKEALFERIKMDAMAELEGRISLVLRPDDGPRERLVALMREYVAWCLERFHLARLLMDELPPHLDLDDEGMRTYYGLFFRARDLLEEAMAKGFLPGRDPLLEVSVAQAALWGIVSQFRAKRVHPRFWDSIDPLVDRYIDFIFMENGGSQ